MMKYLAFEIENYRAISKQVRIDISKSPLVPLVGINECGKTTVLQAIYCFDEANDDEYDGKHLKNCKNLYKTDDAHPPVIRAVIRHDHNELRVVYRRVAKAYNAHIKIKQKFVPTEFPIDESDLPEAITIERNLSTRKYGFCDPELMAAIAEPIQSAFAAQIVKWLPYILYNDDFNDRPPNVIEIPKEETEQISGYLAIFERLFQSTDESYSVFKLAKEKDDNRRDSILADVEHKLNETVTKDWKRFSVTRSEGIRIRLKFVPDDSESPDRQHQLRIQIVEEIDGKERYFDVADRSKGFLWFFNFVMKLEFNPKYVEEGDQTVYLLDEPGSYLHLEAQKELCKKLVSISKNHGVVIYCTHSHKLLDPSLIPLNKIYVVEKSRRKEILVTPLPRVKTKVESNNAFQPIIEATQIPAFEFSISSERVIVLEGIYDKYAVSSMLDLAEDVIILPSTSANSITKNIQYLNAYNKHYIAIWDNDDEGRKELSRAKTIFGDVESKRFDLLPKGTRASRRMEDMFEPVDLDVLKGELNLDASATYESIISAFYFAPKQLKKRAKAKISSTSKQNFEMLKSIIDKVFNRAIEY